MRSMAEAGLTVQAFSDHVCHRVGRWRSSMGRPPSRHGRGPASTAPQVVCGAESFGGLRHAGGAAAGRFHRRGTRGPFRAVSPLPLIATVELRSLPVASMFFRNSVCAWFRSRWGTAPLADADEKGQPSRTWGRGTAGGSPAVSRPALRTGATRSTRPPAVATAFLRAGGRTGRASTDRALDLAEQTEPERPAARGRRAGRPGRAGCAVPDLPGLRLRTLPDVFA